MVIAGAWPASHGLSFLVLGVHESDILSRQFLTDSPLNAHVPRELPAQLPQAADDLLEVADRLRHMRRSGNWRRSESQTLTTAGNGDYLPQGRRAREIGCTSFAVLALKLV